MLQFEPLKHALQEYDVEPAVELAADLPKMGNAVKTQCLQHGNYRGRLAAASADERVVFKRACTRYKIVHDGAADAAPVPVMMNINGELGRAPVGGAASEDFERAPSDGDAIILRHGHGMSG